MRRLPHTLLLFVLTAALALPGSGASAQGKAEDIQLVVETPQYVLDEQGLGVEGYSLSNIPGAPRLPVWSTVVELPAGIDWSVIESSADVQILRVSTPIPSTPVMEPGPEGSTVPASPEAVADEFSLVSRPDPVIYGADALYPAQVVQAGPEGIARGRRLLPIKVYPFQYNPVTGAIHYRSRIELTIHFAPGQAASRMQIQAAAPVAAGQASLPGLLIRTTDRGLYRLTYNALNAAGAPVSSLDPALLTLWGAGQPVDIEVTGSEDGKFDAEDAVVFYAEPYIGRYMKQNVYRLTWSGEPGRRIATRNGAPALTRAPVTTIRQRARVEYDRQYFSTFTDLSRDADHFFDNTLYPNSGRPVHAVTYTLPLENPTPEGNAELHVNVHGGRALTARDPDQSLTLRFNNMTLGPDQWDGSVMHAITHTVSAESLLDGANPLVLEAALSQLPGIDYYYVYPDWAEIVYPAHARAAGNRRYIEAIIESVVEPADRLYLPLVVNNSGIIGQGATQAVAVGNDIAVAGFTEPAVRVYDVSDPHHAVLLTDVMESESEGEYTATFAGKSDAGYYLATKDGLLAPVSLQLDAASTLQSPANTADYIAIVHRNLWDAVQPLLDHRAAEGLSVAKVDIQDVYDEFSGSRVDPEAIRAFLTYAYHHWNAGGDPPQYVLLVGDGHYDFKGAVRADLPNLIPPYLLNIDPFIGETAADNRFVSVDGEADFLPDMSIGRIPARSPADVTAVADKILTYENNAAPGPWQKQAVFVADTKDDPDYDFHGLSDQTRTALPAPYETPMIYYKATPALDTASEMKAAIKAAFDGGALYLQWFGHAARKSWSKDKVWELSDPAKLSQNTVWPFTAHYSCWTGYFIDIQASPQYGNSEQSLAEAMLLTPGKGSLADFAPSGQHLGSDLLGLNTALANAIFEQRIDRVGLAVDVAKVAYFGLAGASPDVIDTQLLFGDPATRLKLP